MKVLLANSPFFGGGITTFCKELATCLSNDTELTVVLTSDAKSPIEDANVEVLYHDTTTLTVKNALFFIDLINNHIKPDVLIISAATIVSVIIPYLNDNIKVITVSHSGKYFYSDYCAVNHKYIDKIIAASSEYNKRYLERKFHIRNKDKIKVIYNFVADDPELEALRFKKREQTPISIVFAGGSSIGKAPELVAKILKALLKTDLDFKFYWTGKSNIPLTTTIFKRSKLKQIQQLFSSDERLVFPGRIPDKRDFDKLTGSANIMLAPSKNEGCSMALLEGHRAGSIFIVADYENSNSEIVRNGNSGFVVNHKDIDDFVAIIGKIINNHSSFYKYYENSHNTFIKELSYPVWKERVFSVLNGTKNHKQRKSKVTTWGLLRGILTIKRLYYMSLLNRFLDLSFPSYLSFRRQFRDINNRGNNLKI